MSCRSYTLCRSCNLDKNFAEVTTSTASIVEVITSTTILVEVTTSAGRIAEVITSTKIFCRSYSE